MAATLRRRVAGRSAAGLVAIAGLIGSWSGPATAMPVASSGVTPTVEGTLAATIQYRSRGHDRGTWRGPPPHTRWAFTYRGRGAGPLYSGSGWIARSAPPPAYRAAPIARPVPVHRSAPVRGPAPVSRTAPVVEAGPRAWPPRVAGPPPSVPLASDPRETITLPLGSQPRTIVEVIHRPIPWTDGWYASCVQRYRSFDPASGTFLGYDGYRHFCR